MKYSLYIYVNDPSVTWLVPLNLVAWLALAYASLDDAVWFEVLVSGGGGGGEEVGHVPKGEQGHHLLPRVLHLPLQLHQPKLLTYTHTHRMGTNT